VPTPADPLLGHHQIAQICFGISGWLGADNNVDIFCPSVQQSRSEIPRANGQCTKHRHQYQTPSHCRITVFYCWRLQQGWFVTERTQHMAGGVPLLTVSRVLSCVIRDQISSELRACDAAAALRHLVSCIFTWRQLRNSLSIYRPANCTRATRSVKRRPDDEIRSPVGAIVPYALGPHLISRRGTVRYLKEEGSTARQNEISPEIKRFSI